MPYGGFFVPKYLVLFILNLRWVVRPTWLWRSRKFPNKESQCGLIVL